MRLLIPQNGCVICGAFATTTVLVTTFIFILEEKKYTYYRAIKGEGFNFHYWFHFQRVCFERWGTSSFQIHDSQLLEIAEIKDAEI